MHQNFTEGKILGPLLKFAFPVLMALFLQNLYGAVDLLVVGRFGTAADVSAVSTGTMLMHAATFIVTGLAMGVTIISGHKIGEKKGEEAGTLIANSIVFFLSVAFVLTMVIVVFAEPLTMMMKAPAEAFDMTVSYVRICGGGMLAIVAYNLIGSIFRGIGDSKVPLYAVVIASFFNIVGDLILVGLFSMGPSGAAIATILAQLLSVAISYMIIRRRSLPFSISKKDIRWSARTNKQILRLGIPIAAQELLVTISFLFLISIGNSLGVVASAGVGIAERVCGFIMLIPSSYNQSMAAFVSQNEGAGKIDRANRALRISIMVSLLTGILIFYIAFFHGDILAGIFSEDRSVIAAGADYLKAYAIDCLLVSFLFCFIGYFTGRGRTFFVMANGIFGAFAIRIPLAYLFSRIEGISLFGIGLSIPLSTSCQIIICLIYFMNMMRRDRLSMDEDRFDRG